MLTIGDLNLIIKHYAYQIQQRIEDLDHLICPLLPTEQTNPEIASLISRYHGYQVKEERENRLARKLVERVLQIFQFFKVKSNNQNLLNLIYQRITTELQKFFQSGTPDLGELFSYINLLTKPGGVVRVPAEKKRIFSKSLIRDPPKNEQKIGPTISLLNIQRRGTSMAPVIKHSKTPSYHCQKWKVEQVLGGIWNCLDVERGHLVRIRDGNEQQSIREMMRRNDKIYQQVRKWEKRKRGGTEVSEDVRESTILSEMKSNGAKGGVWGCKRRRTGVGTRKRIATLKQNISICL